MRRLLVDHGRHQKRQKRGGGAQNLVLDDLIEAASTEAVPIEELLTPEAALTRLEAIDPRGAQVVVLGFFQGCRTPKSRNTWASPCERWKATGRTRAPGSSASCRRRTREDAML